MPTLPKRPGPYLAAFLVVVLIVLAAWLHHALNSPELQEAVRRHKETQAPPTPAPAQPSLPDLPPAPPPQPAPVANEIRELSSPLNDPNGTIDQDLETLQEVFRLHARVHGGPPEGLNEDIAAHLTGENSVGSILFPPDHRALANGALIDRWGTPFWFHQVSPALTEIRSAGPDRQLFTSDDSVLNDSGVTAPPPESENESEPSSSQERSGEAR
jgi:hypothetical protein